MLHVSEYYHYNDFLDAVEAYELDLEDNRLKAASDIVKKVWFEIHLISLQKKCYISYQNCIEIFSYDNFYINYSTSQDLIPRILE